MPTFSRFRGRTASGAWRWLAGYLVAWAAATGYLAFKGADWTFPLISLGVFGVALSGLALLLTRNARPAPVPVFRPGLELAAVLGFLAVYAVGFLGWGMGAVRHVFPAGREQDPAGPRRQGRGPRGRPGAAADGARRPGGAADPRPRQPAGLLAAPDRPGPDHPWPAQ